MQAAAEIGVSRKRPGYFGLGFFALALISALLVSWQPLQLSIITVFLFAGLHNFMEFRYFLARMPLRWGKSRLFYSVGIGGVLVLTAAYLAIYFGYRNWLWSDQASGIAVASWNTAFALWAASLFYLRGKQKPKTDWAFAIAIGLFIASLAWLIPHYWSLALVYIHPCIALWFFDRQLRRSRPEWRKDYHLGLGFAGLLIALMWLGLACAPAFAENTPLAGKIADHAGASILPGISNKLLVATHVFIETIHYFVWILFIPLIDKRAIPWRLNSIPLFGDKRGFPKLTAIALAISLVLVCLLWFGFSADYYLTRDLYFAFAIAHVLAEFPFLVKML